MAPAGLRDDLLRAVSWLVLSIWLGAFALFPLIALVAFRSLTTTDAGSVVGPVLATLHLYAGGAGVVLAALAALLRRGRWLVVLPLVLSALALYSHFGVTSEISEISPQVFGPGGSEAVAARFNELHQRSMRIFGAITVGLAIAVVLHSRADRPRQAI